MTNNRLKKSDKNAIIGFIIGGFLTWLLPKYIFIDWLNLFGFKFTWWMYIILFFVASGGVMDSLNKAYAYKNMANSKE